MKKACMSVFAICLILILAGASSLVTAADGPPLKENGCAACHKEAPKEPEGADKRSDKIHKIHQGEKVKLECTACHAL
ncbi:MAG: hypothetical protein M0009_05665 [Deltaproteobacteria bacterium]|nr:hypothetical protein [Deltaproteobacteria bacterium]